MFPKPDSKSKKDEQRKTIKRIIKRVEKDETVIGANADDLDDADTIDIQVDIQENTGTVIGFKF